MSDHDDFAFEPIPGLPERLPAGEEMLWQGRPDTAALAREAYGIRWIAGYFALIVLWRASIGYGAAGFGGALAYGLPYVTAWTNLHLRSLQTLSAFSPLSSICPESETCCFLL